MLGGHVGILACYDTTLFRKNQSSFPTITAVVLRVFLSGRLTQLLSPLYSRKNVAQSRSSIIQSAHWAEQDATILPQKYRRVLVKIEAPFYWLCCYFYPLGNFNCRHIYEFFSLFKISRTFFLYLVENGVLWFTCERQWNTAHRINLICFSPLDDDQVAGKEITQKQRIPYCSFKK